MCGICGFVSKSNNISFGTTIRKMTDTLSHRGPDGEGYFEHENIALGHRRLSIIDLYTGNQPIYNERKDKVIVFNGEIYNYLELRNELLEKGHRFTTQTDTEVILHLYEEFGLKSLDKLNGIFAFAIYDLKNEELILARDRFGVKPLFYTFFAGNLVFGSEIKAIAKYPGVEKDINFSALNYYLTFEHVPAPYSIYNNILKLGAGQYLQFKESDISVGTFYKLNYQYKFIEKDENFYINKLDTLVNNSVKRQKISDVPLGSFLSGGIDSSLITAYLVKNTSEKINTFSISFEDKSFDESKYFNKVAEFLGTNHNSMCFTSVELINQFETIINMLDEPFADASLLPTFLLSKFTKQHVTVSLSGDGSDELFGGYPTYFARKVGDNIPSFLYYLMNPIAQMLPVSDNNISTDFKIKKFLQGIKYSDHDLRHQIWLGAYDFNQKRKLFTKEVKQSLGKEIDNLEILTDHMKTCNTENNWERSLWIDMRFYLQDNMLVKVDRASMMNSLEARVPFLDNDLVDFALKIPSHLKYNGKTSKYILKKLAERYLPSDIIYRKKKGFGIPVAKWIKSDLLDLFQSVLDPKKIDQEGYFNSKYVNQLLSEHINNKKDNRKLLWTLLIFELFLNKQTNS